jgi:hypothetical protein
MSGHAARGTGILRNEIYIGRVVWNRMRFIENPATGKRVSRLNPESAWVIDQQPELRIVDDVLWERVQSRLDAIREKFGADDPDRNRYWEKRRSQHVLSDNVVCGCCGRPMTNVGKDYLACTGARKRGTCANGRSIKRGELETLILNGLRERLMAPELVAEFITAFQVEWNRLIGEQGAKRAAR